MHLTACLIDMNSAILLAVVSPVVCTPSTPAMCCTKHFTIKTARPQLDSIHHLGTFPSVTSGSEESAAHPDLSLHNELAAIGHQMASFHTDCYAGVLQRYPCLGCLIV